VIYVYFPAPAAIRKKKWKTDIRSTYCSFFLYIKNACTNAVLLWCKQWNIVRNVVQPLTALKKTPTKKSLSLLATSWYHQFEPISNLMVPSVSDNSSYIKTF